MAEFQLAKDDLIKQNTGKTIANWQFILDKFQAMEKSPDRVKKHLKDCYNLNDYWSDAVITKYLQSKS